MLIGLLIFEAACAALLFFLLVREGHVFARRRNSRKADRVQEMEVVQALPAPDQPSESPEKIAA